MKIKDLRRGMTGVHYAHGRIEIVSVAKHHVRVKWLDFIPCRVIPINFKDEETLVGEIGIKLDKRAKKLAAKKNVGKPRRDRTIAATIRVNPDTWAKMGEAYPKKRNKMINEFIKDAISPKTKSNE